MGLMAIWTEWDQSFGGKISSTGFKEVMLERKKTQVVQFLMKLRPEFEPIRDNILNKETLPNINVAFGKSFIRRCVSTLKHPWICPSQLTQLCILQKVTLNPSLGVHLKSLDHNALIVNSMGVKNRSNHYLP